MASFISRILSAFSGGSSEKAQPGPMAEPQVYEGLTIHATPLREGNQYRLAGRIEKTVGEETFVRTFIRADIFASPDDALDCTFRKARQIIDQNRASLFADGETSRSV